jgi:hypothetical protein
MASLSASLAAPGAGSVFFSTQAFSYNKRRVAVSAAKKELVNVTNLITLRAVRIFDVLISSPPLHQQSQYNISHINWRHFHGR